MKFTTPCFVRVENTEEREELLKWAIEIGYHHLWEPREHRYGSFVICNENYVGKAIRPDDFADCDFVDCGTDVELFKALAAMNDDNDLFQYFTDGFDWDFSEWNDFDSVRTTEAECEADNVGYLTFCQEYGYRKATVEEIVEHFKNK